MTYHLRYFTIHVFNVKKCQGGILMASPIWIPTSGSRIRPRLDPKEIFTGSVTLLKTVQGPTPPNAHKTTGAI
jgi:hypothetical protein